MFADDVEAVDCEFYFLDRIWDYTAIVVVCIVLIKCNGDRIVACPMLGRPFSLLKPHLQRPGVVIAAHHASAEWHCLRAVGLPIPKLFDTELAARYLSIRDDGFLESSYTLLTCCDRIGRRTRSVLQKERARQQIINRDFRELNRIVEYCGDDSEDAQALARSQLARLRCDSHFPELQETHQRLMEIHDRGLNIDVESYSQITRNSEELLLVLQRRLKDAGFQGKFDHFERLSSVRHNLDVQRTLMVCELDEILAELKVFERDLGVIGWQRRSMTPLFKGDLQRHEFLRAASDYHSLLDLIRFDWRFNRDSDDKVRFGWTFPGTSSYRISPRAPHPLQLPKHFRPIVTAAPGNAIVEIDYECQEVPLAAAWFDSPKLLRLFNECTGDLYRTLGIEMGILNSATPDIEAARDMVKIAILAMLYGGELPAIQQNLLCSEEEAVRYLEAFRRTFSCLYDGRNLVMRQIRADKFAENIVGWKRAWRPYKIVNGEYYPSKLSYLNFPVQAGGAAIMSRVLFTMPSWIQIVATCHDAVLIECPKDAVPDVIRTAKLRLGRKHYFSTGGMPTPTKGAIHLLKESGVCLYLVQIVGNRRPPIFLTSPCTPSIRARVNASWHCTI